MIQVAPGTKVYLGAAMNPKITPDHLGRDAAVYVRQSTMSQVVGNTESQLRQYALVESARAAGFASVVVIDDDLGRSGSGTLTESQRNWLSLRLTTLSG